MSTYHFTVHPVGAGEYWDRFEELSDSLFGAGCDDATPGISNGLLRIPFHREASTFEEAVGSALTQVRSVGLEVDRVEIERRHLPVAGARHAADALPAAA